MKTTFHPPLSEPVFFILLSLSSGAKHGYAIMKEVDELSEGRVLLSTGTLYGAIKRLLDDGWIRRVDSSVRCEPRPNAPDRGRKAYALTEQGRRVLSADIERLRKLVEAAQVKAVRSELLAAGES